jgi:hypothetical protein
MCIPATQAPGLMSNSREKIVIALEFLFEFPGIPIAFII